MESILQALNGRKTYLSAAAAILSAVATIAGVVSPTTGVAIAAICLALAHMAQRLATATTAEQIVQAIVDGKAELQPALKPLANPTINLFNPSPDQHGQ